MKWGKTLILKSNFDVEVRLQQILRYIAMHYTVTDYYLSGVDATGPLGNALTQELNSGVIKQYNEEELLSLLKEDGQIFDMYLSIVGRENFLISVQGGTDIDVLGRGEPLPSEVIGDHTEMAFDQIQSYKLKLPGN